MNILFMSTSLYKLLSLFLSLSINYEDKVNCHFSFLLEKNLCRLLCYLIIYYGDLFFIDTIIAKWHLI